MKKCIKTTSGKHYFDRSKSIYWQEADSTWVEKRGGICVCCGMFDDSTKIKQKGKKKVQAS